MSVRGAVYCGVLVDDGTKWLNGSSPSLIWVSHYIPRTFV